MNDITDTTNRLEHTTHLLNESQRESVRLELRQEDYDRMQRLLVRLWNAMVRTEGRWVITIDRSFDADLLREFEQVVLDE